MSNGNGVAIIGTGAYAPERVLTNADLEKMVDTTDEWITSRTGIKERRMVAPGEATSDMSYMAAKNALESAGIDAKELELIIIGTSSPDMFFPNTACLLQDKLHAKNAFCMDVNAACSGFLYALDVAWQYMRTGHKKTALVVGSDTITSFVNFEDRATCILFGDGAGAVVLKQTDQALGIRDSVLGSDGSLHDFLLIPGGGSRNPPTAETLKNKEHTIKMSGKDVFKFAVNNMSQAARDVLDRVGWKKEDISLLIPHQANMRILKAIRHKLNLSEDKVFVNLHKYGNTSAASIGIAMDEAAKSGKLKKGDKVLLIAFGAGFTWGAIALDWTKE